MTLALAFLLFAADDLPQMVKRFIDVFAAIEREAADPVPIDKAFYEGAIPASLRPLDPHSVFFDPGQFEQLQQMQKSTSKGFGSVVSVLPGRVIVLQCLPGAPMARSGISPGDEIVGINGIQLAYLEVEQLVQVLGASRGQPARIDVRRPSNARLLQFVLTPEAMQSPSVDRAFFPRPGVGYVRIASFDNSTGKDVKAAIEKLGGAGLHGLVLDMRNNPGGVLAAALETAALFLKPGDKILSVKGRSVKGEEVTVPPNNIPYEFPVAVLLNGKSASAAEVVGGALQDHKRAKIIGETSYGKGLVESVFPLSNGTGIALTTAFYYTPSGRSIQKPLKGGTLDDATSKGEGGIKPDIPAGVEPQTRLRAVLDASGSFPTFAAEFLRANKDVTAEFTLPARAIDQFKVFLSQRNIQPGIAEWSSEGDWIANRLKQEILNQAVGVEKGDEVEMQRDPQVQAALKIL
jgi:carboxyl-terminal processing protease